MKRKIYILIGFLLSLQFVVIWLNSCGNRKAPMYCSYYVRASLSTVDNSDSVPHTPTSAGVKATAFALKLTLTDTTYTCMKRVRYSFINEAYAEKFATYKSVPLDSMHITSDHDFDATHPAGSDLKYLFNISDTIKRPHLNVGSNKFLLLHSPSDTGTHIFTIKLFMADSTKNLITSATPVKLLL